MLSEVENNLCMYLSCLVVLLGSMSVGTMLGLSSPLIPDIQNDPSAHTPHMTVEAASWFGVRPLLISACNIKIDRKMSFKFFFWLKKFPNPQSFSKVFKSSFSNLSKLYLLFKTLFCIQALITLGGMAGGIVAGFIMQEIGRKMTTVISSVPYIVGIIVSLMNHFN